MAASTDNRFKTISSAGGLVVILVIVALVNVIFASVNLRWDVTEDRLYSLSQGSREIIDTLQNEVVIKVFYSRSVANMPMPFKSYANRVIDFLREYEYHGKGKVKIEIYDPRLDSEEEEWAMKYGVRGVNMPTGERIYLGLAVVSADQEETIEFLDPNREEHLEYDITRIITRIQGPEKPKIGVISGLPVFGQPKMPYNIPGQPPPEPAWLFINELGKTYEVVQIEETAEALDKDLALVILFQPKQIGDPLLFAVDQYLLGGGNLIVMVDPMPTTENTPMGRPQGFALDKMFKTWGVSVASDKIVADMDLATRTMGQDNRVIRNPLVISLASDAFNGENIITNKLESMVVILGGAIEKSADFAYEFEPLIQTSPRVDLVDSYRAQFGMDGMMGDIKPRNEKMALAARISGTFKTAFPGGKPPKGEDDGKDAPAANESFLKEGAAASTIILVADSDFLYDRYYADSNELLGRLFGQDIVNIQNDNLNFLLNASEMLTGSKALISIRSRGTFTRPFTRVRELEKKAQERWLSEEQALKARLEETNRKLRDLEGQKDKSQRFIMSAEQEKEIQKFQEEKVQTNAKLKVVRRNLRAEIEGLGNMLKFINILLIPLLVAAFGVAFAVYRQRQSGRRV